MAIVQSFSGNQLPEWYEALLRDMAERSQYLRQAEPSFYRGQRIAPIQPDMRRAMHLSRREGMVEPYIASANTMVNNAASSFPQRAHEYMNPYQQHVVDRMREEGMRNLTEGVLPALEGYFIQKGQHGSSKHARMAERAARDAQNEILKHQQGALATGYQQAGQLFNADQARALNAAENKLKLGISKQAANLSDVAALENMGRYNQQQLQAQNEEERKHHMEQSEYPMQQLSNQSALLNGMSVPSSQAYIHQSPNAPQANVASNLASVAGGFLNMLNRRRGGTVRWGRI